MRLDASYIHFISKEELRILSAIEIGMRNHQYVPLEVIARIGNLKGGQTFKIVRKLLKNKFITHVGKKYDGYKLTYLGYDYQVLQTFMKRGLVKDVIMKIGVGKQSDIYKCVTPEGEHIVLKLTRLGRNSFRTIKKNRQYIQNRTSYNWLYLSRLSSMRQFAFMQLLHQNGFPTPKPIDTNRHGILMSLIDGYPLCHIKQIGSQITRAFQQTLKLLQKFASYGLIHGDFNEFNLLINQQGKITVIDFPQCISIKHPNAKQHFDHDMNCVYLFFQKLTEKSSEYLKQLEVKFDVTDYPMLDFDNIQVIKRLDQELKVANHITLLQQKELEQGRKQLQQILQKNANNQQPCDQQQQDCEQDQQEVEQDQEQQIQQKDQEENQQNLQNKQKIKQPVSNTQEKIQTQQVPDFGHEEVILTKVENEYEKQLQNLISQMDFQSEKRVQFKQEPEQDSESQQQQRFKGMTNFQIRQIVKQQKRQQRQKKKAEMSATQYIKHALKTKNKRQIASKGNYGNKAKGKQNYGMKQQMMM